MKRDDLLMIMMDMNNINGVDETNAAIKDVMAEYDRQAAEIERLTAEIESLRFQLSLEKDYE